MRTFNIEWNNLPVEVEAEYIPQESCNTDRGVQIIPAWWEPLKVGWMGINLLSGMEKSDATEGTDFINEIVELINK